MRRGTTLIELMIVVGLIGVTVGVAGAAATQSRVAALAELQRERAAQLLEYEADCLSAGREPQKETVAALSDALPGAGVKVQRQGDLATITVAWRAPGGAAASRALTVFGRGAR